MTTKAFLSESEKKSGNIAKVGGVEGQGAGRQSPRDRQSPFGQILAFVVAVAQAHKWGNA